MKVVAINGSPKKDGNTNYAIGKVLEVLENNGVETEIIHIGNKVIRGCSGCGGCIKNRNERCIVDDCVNESIQIIKEADGILLGSPVYFAGLSGTMKAFLERIFYVAGVNGNMFRHKVGAAVVAVRREGGIQTFNELNAFLLYCEMFIPTSNYWNIIQGRGPMDAVNDAEGNQIMKVLGQNYLYLLQMKEHSKGIITPPEKEKKIFS